MNTHLEEMNVQERLKAKELGALIQSVFTLSPQDKHLAILVEQVEYVDPSLNCYRGTSSLVYEVSLNCASSLRRRRALGNRHCGDR